MTNSVLVGPIWKRAQEKLNLSEEAQIDHH